MHGRWCLAILPLANKSSTAQNLVLPTGCWEGKPTKRSRNKSTHSGALLKDVITPSNVTLWLCYLQLNYIMMTSLLNPNSPNYSLEIYYLIL